MDTICIERATGQTSTRTSVAKVCGLFAHAPDFILLDGQLDLEENGVDVGQPLVEYDLTGQGQFRRQQAAFVVRPDFLAVLAILEGGREGSEVGAQIEHVTLEHFGGIAVARRIDGLQVLVPAATPACREHLERQLAASPLHAGQLRLLDGRAREAMVAADVVLLASGTATLEAMLAKRPMVVGYRIAPSTYRIVRALGLLKIDRFALPNVLAGDTIAPELMQDDCTPEKLAAAVLAWFRDGNAVTALEPVYRALHLALRRDASASAAEAVAGQLATTR